MVPLATCGHDQRPRWVASKLRLEWRNGALCVFFSGEELESLRGPQCELCVIDEMGRMRYQQAVFDTIQARVKLAETLTYVKPLRRRQCLRLTRFSAARRHGR